MGIRLKNLGKQEFEADCEVKQYRETLKNANSTEQERYTAEIGLELALLRLRNIQKKLYGWRMPYELDGKPAPELKEIERLKREILDLETREVQYQNCLTNYANDLKVAEGKLENLRSQLGSDIGYNPESDTLKAAQEEVLRIGSEASIAEISLPRIREKLEELRKDLQKRENEWENIKKHPYVEGETYPSPEEEIDAKAQKYAQEHNCSYAMALSEVFRSEPTLARVYVFGLEN